MEKKESYMVVIDGVRYDAVKQEVDALGLGSCKGCVFNGGSECTLSDIVGLSLSCDGDHTFVSRGEVATQQQPAERSEEEANQAGKETERKEAGETNRASIIVAPKEGKEFAPSGAIKADKVIRASLIGKRSYYSFPNGVKAEDICRYLPFNLGNVVKYVCQAGRKNADKKVEDFREAMVYLVDEIKRMEEGDD